MAGRIPADPREGLPGPCRGHHHHGPHARGVTDPDFELHVLVLIKDGSRETKDAISYLGHFQAVTTRAVPLIFVYTESEWAEHRRLGAPFYEMARDGVSVA